MTIHSTILKISVSCKNYPIRAVPIPHTMGLDLVANPTHQNLLCLSMMRSVSPGVVGPAMLLSTINASGMQ